MIRRGFLKALAVAAALAVTGGAQAQDIDPDNVLVLEIAGEANGTVEILLRPDVAPLHVQRIKDLTREGLYDGIAFHRVIDGFMAQTGDVQYGKIDGFSGARAGTGHSDLPNVPAEFSNLSFDTGIVGMARANPVDSANSQFFIMLAPGSFLDGNYTVFGRVISGMEVVNAIKKGEEAANGMIAESPDYIVRATILGDQN